jgi:hypothetical protein
MRFDNAMQANLDQGVDGPDLGIGATIGRTVGVNSTGGSTPGG